MQSTIQPTKPTPMSLPRPDGGGVSAADGGGLSSPPSSPLPTAHCPLPLTVPILESLLDPAMTPTLICQAHNLTLKELQAITESAAYKKSTAAIESINTTRQSTINSNLRTQSLAVLRDLITDTTTAAQDAESSFASPVLTGEVSSEARRRGASLSPSSTQARNLAIQARLQETARKATATLLKHTTPPPIAGCHGLTVPGKPCLQSPPSSPNSLPQKEGPGESQSVSSRASRTGQVVSELAGSSSPIPTRPIRDIFPNSTQFPPTQLPSLPVWISSTPSHLTNATSPSTPP